MNKIYSFQRSQFKTVVRFCMIFLLCCNIHSYGQDVTIPANNGNAWNVSSASDILSKDGGNSINRPTPKVSKSPIGGTEKGKGANYTTFATPLTHKEDEVTKANKGYENDPELGMLFSNAPCKDCYEDISMRTEKAKTFFKIGSLGKEKRGFVVQSGTLPMHYRDEQGRWRTIQDRLTPTNKIGLYAMDNHLVNVAINTVEGFTSLTKDNNVVNHNRNLELIYIKPDGSEMSLGIADYSHYTVGDDGMYITNAWPGIDIEISVNRKGEETSFILNHSMPAYAAGKLVVRDHVALNNGLSIDVPAKKDYSGEIKIFNKDKEEIFNVTPVTAFSKNDTSFHPDDLKYQIAADNTIDIDIPGYFLNKPSSVYPIIVDPTWTATTPGVPGVTDYYYFGDGCITTVNVPIPAGGSISALGFTYTYYARTAGNLAFQLDAGTCVSPAASTGYLYYYYCGTNGNCAVSTAADVDFPSTCFSTFCSAGNLPVSIDVTDFWYTSTYYCASTPRYYSVTQFTANITGTILTIPATISGNTTVCVGSSTSLSDANTGGTWSTTAGSGSVTVGTDGTVTGVTVGTATVIYSLNGCTASVVVTITTAPGTINANTPVCAGNNITLTDGTSGGTWSTTAGSGSVTVVGSTGVVTGGTAGTATVSYSLGGTCYTSVIVTVTAAPGAIGGNAPVCIGLNITLTDGTSGGTWSTTNGSGSVSVVGSTGVVTGSTAGTATVTYSLGGSCYQTVTVTVNGSPGVINGVTTVCNGSNTTLTDGTAGGTWSASNGSGSVSVVGSTGVVTGTSAGTATVTYSMGASCYSTVTVTVNTSPVAGAITGTLSVCSGLTTTLGNATASGGTGTWSSGNTAVGTVGSTTGVVYGVSAGTTIITFTETSVSCGTATTTATVSVNATPVAGAITGTLSVCSGLTTT